MPQRVQLNAGIDSELVKALKIRLIQDDLSYRAWLDQRIREYVGKSRASPKQRRKRLKPRG